MKSIYIIEGINKAGKTTFIKDNFCDYTIIKLPGLFLKDHIRDLINFKENSHIFVPLLASEHIAVLNSLLKEAENFEVYKKIVFDRSFISFFVYQEEYKNDENYKIYFDIIKQIVEKLKKFYTIEVLLFLKKLSFLIDDEIEKKENENLIFYKNKFLEVVNDFELNYKIIEFK